MTWNWYWFMSLDEDVGLGLRDKGFRELLKATLGEFLGGMKCGGPGHAKGWLEIDIGDPFG